MIMRRFWILTRALMTIQFRNASTLFWSFAFPIGIVLLYGAIWGNQEFNGVRGIDWLMVGIIVLNIMSSGFMGDSAWLTDSRERGILLRIRATPLPAIDLISAYVLTRLVLVVLQTAAIAAVAILAYGASIPLGGLLPALLFVIFGGLVFIVLGQAIAAVAPNMGACIAIGQALFFPLMFVSNLFMPLEIMPFWVGLIAAWTPAFMLVDALRPLLMPSEALQQLSVNMIGLTVYLIAGIALSARFFGWAPRR
jgi:ABC-2 type transport system permease protein